MKYGSQRNSAYFLGEQYFFVTDIAYSWALVDSNCISEVMSITYLFVMIVFVPCTGISCTSGDQESYVDKLWQTTALIYVNDAQFTIMANGCKRFLCNNTEFARLLISTWIFSVDMSVYVWNRYLEFQWQNLIHFLHCYFFYKGSCT